MTSPSGTVRRPAIPFAATVMLVGTLGTIYIVSQFLRSSVGVIAPNLASELSLSAAEIGLLSSTFFFAFAAAQIPLGIGLDRYGPKMCMLVCAAVAIAGALLFAVAASPALLIAARVLMGLGSCCYLMAPLAVYARRYPPDRFGTLVGVQMGVGSIGTLLATAPLAWSVSFMGWRSTFVAVAALMLLSGLLVALVVREDEPAHDSGRHETLRESIAGTLQALRTKSVVPLFLMNLCGYSSFILVVGLWGGPYLTHIYGFGLTERGDMLFVAAVAQIVGAFLYGPTDRLFRSYKIPVLLGAVLTAMTLAVAAFVGRIPENWLVIWFVLLGALAAYTPVMIAHGKSLFPPQLVGRGMTLLNIGSMGGVFVTQTVTGFVIDAFPAVNGAYPLDAYRAVFALQAAALTVAIISYFWARDPWRRS
jgi:MFS family permease